MYPVHFVGIRVLSSQMFNLLLHLGLSREMHSLRSFNERNLAARSWRAELKARNQMSRQQIKRSSRRNGKRR